ncbi:hypothetical protein AC141_42330 [Bacteroides fragilis]|nr:hypothetical protein AC141_42330 [Bacteroides fragilis]
MRPDKTFGEIRKRRKRFPKMLTSFGQNVPVFFLGRSLSLPGTRALFHQKPLFGESKTAFS